MLDKKHERILRSYEKRGLIPKVISQERHIDEFGKQKNVFHLGAVNGMHYNRFDTIIPVRPISRMTLWRWKQEDLGNVSK